MHISSNLTGAIAVCAKPVNYLNNPDYAMGCFTFERGKSIVILKIRRLGTLAKEWTFLGDHFSSVGRRLSILVGDMTLERGQCRFDC